MLYLVPIGVAYSERSDRSSKKPLSVYLTIICAFGNC